MEFFILTWNCTFSRLQSCPFPEVFCHRAWSAMQHAKFSRVFPSRKVLANLVCFTFQMWKPRHSIDVIGSSIFVLRLHCFDLCLRAFKLASFKPTDLLRGPLGKRHLAMSSCFLSLHLLATRWQCDVLVSCWLGSFWGANRVSCCDLIMSQWYRNHEVHLWRMCNVLHSMKSFWVTCLEKRSWRNGLKQPVLGVVEHQAEVLETRTMFSMKTLKNTFLRPQVLISKKKDPNELLCRCKGVLQKNEKEREKKNQHANVPRDLPKENILCFCNRSKGNCDSKTCLFWLGAFSSSKENMYFMRAVSPTLVTVAWRVGLLADDPECYTCSVDLHNTSEWISRTSRHELWTALTRANLLFSLFWSNCPGSFWWGRLHSIGRHLFLKCQMQLPIT